MQVLGNIERTVMDAPAGAGLLHLLDAWLRPTEDWSLRDEYPRVFGPGSHALQHVLHDHDKILAHAATVDIEHAGHGREIAVRLVGSVVVHPDHRAEGFGTRLIRLLAEDFAKDCCDLLLLWSDQDGFYGRCGFQPVGTEHILRLGPSRLGPGLGMLRRAHAEDVPSLLALHAAKPSGTRRDESDFAAWLAIPRCETWVLAVDDRVLAYASLGRGLDFRDHIHEVGGRDTEVASLVSSLLMQKQCELGLLLPPYRLDLRTLLRPSLIAETRTRLGMGIQKSPIPPDFYLEGFDSI